MTTRRTFMQLGLVATGAATAGLLYPEAPSQMALQDVDLLVIDRSVTKTKYLARANASVPIIEIDGDMFSVWQTSIRERLVQKPIRVGGVTKGHSAFSLAQVAKDYGYELTHSSALEARRLVNPYGRDEHTLAPWDINRPAMTQWIMSKTGIAFRTT